MISVTLTIDDYSAPSEVQSLSQAFAEGQDRALVIALSKTKAVGHCSINGALSYDIAFIQMVVTPTGRKITFITNRPPQMGEDVYKRQRWWWRRQFSRTRPVIVLSGSGERNAHRSRYHPGKCKQSSTAAAHSATVDGGRLWKLVFCLFLLRRIHRSRALTQNQAFSKRSQGV